MLFFPKVKAQFLPFPFCFCSMFQPQSGAIAKDKGGQNASSEFCFRREFEKGLSNTGSGFCSHKPLSGVRALHSDAAGRKQRFRNLQIQSTDERPRPRPQSQQGGKWLPSWSKTTSFWTDFHMQPFLCGVNLPAYFPILFFALTIDTTKFFLYLENQIGMQVTMFRSSKRTPYCIQ